MPCDCEASLRANRFPHSPETHDRMNPEVGQHDNLSEARPRGATSPARAAISTPGDRLVAGLCLCELAGTLGGPPHPPGEAAEDLRLVAGALSRGREQSRKRPAEGR